MVNTKKFSEFTVATLSDSSAEYVGVESGTNMRSDRFPTWTTAGRPTPPFDALMGYNTSLNSYEYYEAATGVWQQFQSGGDVAALVARLAAHTAGDGASMIGLQDQGSVLSKNVQQMSEAAFIVQTNNGTLLNAQALGSLTTGIVKNTTATGVLSIAIPGTDYYAPGDIIPLSDGGTNADLSASAALGGVVYSTATALAILAPTNAANRPLMSGNLAAPTWSTATYPSTTTINQLLYSSANNTVVGLATANNSVLVTSAGGVPSLSDTLPSAVLDNITHVGVQDADLNMGSHYITSLLDPANAQDAATKNYVDVTVAQFASIFPARAATTGALTSTYLNGAAGIGATLTNAGAMAAFELDGVTLNLDDLVLIKDQAAAEENGYYKVTTVGSGAVNWVLTRSINYDEPSEISPGDLFVVTEGATQGNSTWIETSTVTTIGTDPIVFIQYSVALPIPLSAGGTGASLVASDGGIFYSTATAGAILAGTNAAGRMLQSGNLSAPSWSTPTWPSASGTSGTFLQSNGTNNIYSAYTFPTTVPTVGKIFRSDGTNMVGSTATYPDVATTTGTILRADGTNWVASTATYPNTTTANQLLYSSANNTITGLATANSSVLVTDSGGIPSLSTTLPADLKLTTPWITTGIKDVNGNLILGFTAVGSADNYLAINNSTGNSLTVTATGADATLDIWFQNKGTAFYRFQGTSSNGGRLVLYENTSNGTDAILLQPPESMAATRTVQMADTDIACWVVQRASVETGAVATGTTVIPYDDTIPQSGEGIQFMTLAITPKNAANILVIDVTIALSTSAATLNLPQVALFQDSTANALAAMQGALGAATAGSEANVTFRHVMTAGTTSATTFKVRAGYNGAGTTTFNGNGGARIYGGVMASSITITEYSS